MQPHRQTQGCRFPTPLLVLGVVFVLAHGLLALAQGEQPEKSPEPGKTEQAKAEKLIHALFADRIKQAKTDPAAAAKLAKDLLEEGLKTTDDKTLRFVAFCQARDLAAQAGDMQLGLAAIAELAKHYAVDTLTMKADMVANGGDRVTTADAAENLIQMALLCLDEALATDNFKSAAAVVAAAEKAVLKVEKKIPTAALIQKRADAVEAARKEFDRLKPLRAKLTKDMDDAEANLEVGRYVVAVNGDFKRGLPMLAKSKDAHLKNLAKRDLDQPTGVKERVALGDEWDRLAEDLKGLPKRHLYARAFHWYEKALPELSGLSKVRINRRVEELANIVADPKVVKKEFTNSFGMKFVWIKPGTFIMGSPNNEAGRGGDEGQFRVKISKGFYMGVYPVTQKQWQAVMGNNPSTGVRGDDNPVETISWPDCQEFVKKLSAKEGKKYALPTEAEWEYACRAGTTTEFYSGNGEEALRKVGWYSGNSTNRSQPVGKLAPNAWGLYDMHGNIFQWCEDWLGPYPMTDLQDATKFVVDPKGSNNGTSRVLRGGFWGDSVSRCRSALRGFNDVNQRNSGCGVRVCVRLD